MEGQKKRERVLKACEFCRRRKVRCDGSHPCLTCQSNKTECLYKNNPPRKKERKKQTKIDKVDKNLNGRLSRLEGLLEKLLTKIDPLTVSSLITPESAHLENEKRHVDHDSRVKTGANDVSSSTENEEVTEEEEEEEEANHNDDDEEEEENDENDVILPRCMPRADHPKKSKSTMDDPLEHMLDKHELFVNVHLMFTLFSNKSLEEITALSGTSENTDKIIGFQYVFKKLFKKELIGWVRLPLLDEKSREEIMYGDFPFGQEFTNSVIRDFYPFFAYINMLVPIETVLGYFKIYFDRKLGKHVRRLKISELLIMNVAICGCMSICESVVQRGVQVPTAVDMSFTNQSALKVWHKHEERMHSNLILYYRMVLLISDGVDTVIAILCLCVFLDFNNINMDVNSVLLTVAVTISREIGLDRPESYQNISAEEIYRRKATWFSCVFLDTEYCFRMGRPRIITESSSSEFFWDVKRDVAARFNDDIYFPRTVCFDLVSIRIFSYNSILSERALNQPLASLMANLDAVNKDTFNLIEKIDQLPVPKTSNVLSFFNTESWVSFLQAHFHLLVMNKIPSIITDYTNEDILRYKQISLNSARQILRSSQNSLWVRLTDFIDIFTLFYPLVAFLHLCENCIHNPSSPQTFDDVNLLIECSLGYFQDDINRYTKRHLNIVKLKDILARILLKNVIAVVENNLSFRFNHPRATEFLDGLDTKYGHLFKYFRKNQGYPPNQTLLRHIKSAGNRESPTQSDTSSNFHTDEGMSGLDFPTFMADFDFTDEAGFDPFVLGQIYGIPNLYNN